MDPATQRPILDSAHLDWFFLEVTAILVRRQAHELPAFLDEVERHTHAAIDGNGKRPSIELSNIATGRMLPQTELGPEPEAEPDTEPAPAIRATARVSSAKGSSNDAKVANATALKKLKMKPLKQLASQVGVVDDDLEEADEADSVSGAVIELILHKLWSLKNRDLCKMVAHVSGRDTDDVEDAMDEAPIGGEKRPQSRYWLTVLRRGVS
jgi:hypothetical protein